MDGAVDVEDLEQQLQPGPTDVDDGLERRGRQRSTGGGEGVDDGAGAVLGGHRDAGEVGPDVAVLGAGHEQHVGALGGPPGTTDLLVVGHRGGRRADVDDEAEVGLVEAHPQRRGGDERLDLVVAQRLLEPLAFGRVGASGVGGNPMASLGEGACQVFRRSDGERVDDAAAGQLTQVGEQPPQPAFGTHARQDAQAQRRARQPTADRANFLPRVCRAAGLLPPELALHVRDDAGVRGSCRGQDRRAGRKSPQQVADPPVVGSEVVAPVADAVGLVDDEQTGPGRQIGELLDAECRVVEPLGTDQEDVDRVLGQGLAYLGPVEGVGGVHRHRPDAGPGGGGDLVTHEREQRRDDDRRPGAVGSQQCGRDEVDRRLAPPRALDDQHSFAVPDQGEHRLELSLVEIGVGAADESPQRRPRVLLEITVHTRHRMPPRRHPRTRQHDESRSTGNAIGRRRAAYRRSEPDAGPTIGMRCAVCGMRVRA